MTLACTRIGFDTLVAVIHCSAATPVSVALYRLEELRLTKLDVFDLVVPQSLLFRGDRLLANCYKDNDDKLSEIIEVRATVEGFSRARKILKSDANVALGAWCLAGERLVLWDRKSKDLLLYTFE